MDFAALCRQAGKRAEIGVNDNTMIQFINVSKEFHNGTVGLKNIDVKIDEGEFVFLVGASWGFCCCITAKKMNQFIQNFLQQGIMYGTGLKIMQIVCFS